MQNNVLTSATATTPTVITDDYSIQPGSGGWGMIFQWQAFRDLGHNTTIYTNGNYLATQGGTNNVLRSATALSQPLTAYNAIQDQYLLQAGSVASHLGDQGPDADVRPAHGRRAGRRT